MRTVNIGGAKTHLARLIEREAAGEPFIITKPARPLVEVMPIHAPERRLGFLAGQGQVPDDFERMGDEESERVFGRAV